MRSRSHGRPLARWSVSDTGLNCCDDPDVVDLRVVAVAEREVDQPVGSREGHGRLGAAVGEQLEAAAGAAGEDQGEGSDARHAADTYPVSVR